MENSVSRTCLTCGRNLHGRTDKKFCNEYCRNTYNNRLNNRHNNGLRYIDNCIRRNRRIMQQLLGARQGAHYSSASLSARGFLFSYCTHTHINRNGVICYFCYDYGYRLKGKDLVQIMKLKAQEEKTKPQISS
ncbi:MAG: hypothetical protein JO301_16840 [Chitinophagaceae bacterium]|nr:hypothetical protein [Chitinophagaceae bacterium]